MILRAGKRRVWFGIEAIYEVAAMPPFISHLVKVPPLHLVVGFGLVVCMELVGEEVGHSEQDWHMCFAQNAHATNIFGQAGS